MLLLVVLWRRLSTVIVDIHICETTLSQPYRAEFGGVGLIAAATWCASICVGKRCDILTQGRHQGNLLRQILGGNRKRREKDGRMDHLLGEAGRDSQWQSVLPLLGISPLCTCTSTLQMDPAKPHKPQATPRSLKKLTKKPATPDSPFTVP
jgi:hypothetical protein